MRYCSGYKKTLNASITTSLDYISHLVDALPPAVFVSSTTFTTNPQVNAYFASVPEIRETFSNSTELRDFFNTLENINADEAYALLCMNESEKTVLGMELHEDIIQREVMQTTLDFSEHKILSPASNEAEVRKGIKQCIFDGLITHALHQIIALKHQKRELEIQHSILVTRLKARLSQSSGLNSLLAHTADSSLLMDIEQEISENEKQLQTLPASWESLQYYLDVIKDTLSHPEKFIRIKTKSFNLNKMKVVVSDNTSPSVNNVHFNEILIANVLKKVITIVHYPRSEILPRQKF